MGGIRLSGVSGILVYPQVWVRRCLHACLVRFFTSLLMQFWGLSCVFVPLATWLLIVAMSCLWPGCFDSRICPRARVSWMGRPLSHLCVPWILSHPRLSDVLWTRDSLACAFCPFSSYPGCSTHSHQPGWHNLNYRA